MKANKIVKNATWIIGCKIIKAILTVIVTMITARYLGPSNYGLISYAASIVTFVTPIMKLGLDSIIVHEIINNPDGEGKILGTTILANLISATLCIIGISSFVCIVNKGESETIVVCVIYSMLLLFQAIEMIQYWFQAKVLSKYSAISMLISYIIVTLFQIYISATGKGIYWFAISYSIDFFIIAVLLLYTYKKKKGQKLKFSFLIFKRMFAKSKYYIVSSMMVTIFAQTDKIMLKLMVGNEAVGYYSAAVTSANMISFVFAAIIDSVRPSIFEGKVKSKECFENRLKNLYTIIIYCSLIISLILTILSPLVVRILYGKEYIASISSLRIVVWYTTFSYLGTVRNIWIVAENKQKYLWIINFSGAILNVVINYILIPLYGINGAAIASLITQIFTNFVLGFIIRPIKDNNRIIIDSLNPNNIFAVIKKIK